ncbi:MAG TPA: hypothetical protein PKJ63_07830 [Cyclobacteriaceae bacterium]|nr:hypothetical protein [Cyclobacteriaceae bacterium]
MKLYSQEHLGILRAFVKHKVKFVIIGGHAAIYHGVNRNTGDLDILIEPTAKNGDLVLTSLKSNGLEIPEMDLREFESNLVLSFGLEPDAVDIINYAPGVTFNQVFENSINVDVEGISIKMMDIRDLLKNKEALNRGGEKSHLDKYDIEVLRRIIGRK